MKIFRIIILITVLALTLTSCGASAPQPTETAVPTQVIPTETFTPTATAIPTKTPVPPTETPATPVRTMPTSKPVSEWEGLPVMPDAIAGDGDSKLYYFTINASAKEIQSFYNKEMTKLGWDIVNVSGGSPDAISLMYIKEVGVVIILIIPQPDGSMYVMLSQ